MKSFQNLVSYALWLFTERRGLLCNLFNAKSELFHNSSSLLLCFASSCLLSVFKRLICHRRMLLSTTTTSENFLLSPEKTKKTVYTKNFSHFRRHFLKLTKCVEGENLKTKQTKVKWSLRCVGTNVSAAQFRIKSFQISSMGIFCRETVSPRMTVSFASRTACENVWWWRWRSWSTVWRKKVCRRRQRCPSK